MKIFRLLSLAAVVLATSGPLSAGVARAADEDETPPIDAYLQTGRYPDVARREILNQFSYVVGETDRFPGDPTPQQVKKSDLRKRLLDMRLLMDFNAFAYKPSIIQRSRDLVDVAYEAIGSFKDLFDTQEIDGLPIDQAERDRRWNAMINAVEPFRAADSRAKMEKSVDHAEWVSGGLAWDDRPRLWQIAQIEPVDNLDSAGNVARLGYAVLINLRDQGMTVDNIFDPQQEIRFHDVRKALRSVMVLADMFPSIKETVSSTRLPISEVVDAYGKANDQVVAYHESQLKGGVNLDDRAAGLTKAFDKSQKLVRDFVETGQLDAYAAALQYAQSQHQR